jgi:tRNA dimethylallyltransferase
MVTPQPIQRDRVPVCSAWFLVGPTAVGKTAVAQWIAERKGWDILSADSMLVYRGMDIGTAKPSPADRLRVRYFGIDLVEPDACFSCAQYVASARTALAGAAAAGRQVIVTGGTGLYIRGLLGGLDVASPPDPARRAHWNRLFEEKGIAALQDALRGLDPEAYARLADPGNSRRVIRALEFAEAGAGGPRAWRVDPAGAPLAGLLMPAPELNSGIESRVGEMYRIGLVDEVRGLLERYGGLSETARQAIGYAEAIDVIEGRCTVEAAAARTASRTRQYAKRQRTWFRHQVDVAWVDVARGMTTDEIAQRVLAQWDKHGPSYIAAS